MNHQTPQIQKARRNPVIIMLFVLIAAVASPFLLTTLFTVKQHTKTQALLLPQNKIVFKKKSDTTEEKWHTITIKQGDSLAKIFNEMDIQKGTLERLLKQTTYKKHLQHLTKKQQIKLLLNENNELEKLILPVSNDKQLVIKQFDNSFTSQLETLDKQSYVHYVTATIHHSLYTAGKRHNIPGQLLQQLTEIFAMHIDFVKDVRKNDQFTLIYRTNYINGQNFDEGEILAATYTNRGKTYYAIKYTDESGKKAYFTPRGRSLKKAFSRYPVNFSHISSHFSLSRLHPILQHVTRAHKGIDLAAPLGTPIRAVSNGIISQIGRNYGYGNMIKIRHSAKFTTLYAHMLRFRTGLKKGSQVKKGQVIGYVGQTGLATGPHCHFEFIYNGRAVNPATIRLPDASPIPKSKLGKFQPKARTLMAQLKLYEAAKLASKGKNHKASYDKNK